MQGGPSGQTGLGLTRAFSWGGVLLFALFLGGLLGYPYARPYLAALPPTPMPTAAPVAVISPIETRPPRTCVPTPSSTPAPTLTPTPTSTPAWPTRIIIPAIGVDAPVVPVSWQTIEVGGEPQPVWDVPDRYAVGWHQTSAPLGVAGNTVLNGHNTTRGEVFRDLYTLAAGDVITLYSADIPHTYAVTQTLILPEAGQPLEVRLGNAAYIMPTADERVTLVTCHPYGSVRNRLIVIALPVD